MVRVCAFAMSSWVCVCARGVQLLSIVCSKAKHTIQFFLFRFVSFHFLIDSRSGELRPREYMTLNFAVAFLSFSPFSQTKFENYRMRRAKRTILFMWNVIHHFDNFRIWRIQSELLCYDCAHTPSVARTDTHGRRHGNSHSGARSVVFTFDAAVRPSRQYIIFAFVFVQYLKQ